MVLSLLHHGTSLLYSQNNDLQKLLSDSHNNHLKPIPGKMNKKTKEFLKKFCELVKYLNNLKIHLAVTTIFQISKN